MTTTLTPMLNQAPPLPSLPTLSPQQKAGLKLAVMWGGPSSEAAVSQRSATNMHQALLRLGYSQAYMLEADTALVAHLLATPPDGVVNAMHGEMGEDGVIQGLLTWMGIPFNANGVRASALTMDKALTKRILAHAGLPVLSDVVVTLAQLKAHQGDAQTLADSLAEGLTYPLMVKPLSLGSSVGMSKVEEASALPAALAKGLAAEPTVVLEPFFVGHDVTVGVLGYPDGSYHATPVLGLTVADGWYDFEAKYTKGKTVFTVPANLPQHVTQAVQAAAVEAHKATGCSVVSRTDMVVAPTGEFVILEVNSNPGMTDLSDLPAQCAAMGLGYDALVEVLVAPLVGQLVQAG